MTRLLLQSGVTFHFLYVDARGDVGWTPSLASAMRSGIVYDYEEAAQLCEDWFDRGSALVVDLDGESH